MAKETATPTQQPQHPEPLARPEDFDMGQIVERLRWTPQERFRYFLGMVEFLELARNARRVK